MFIRVPLSCCACNALLGVLLAVVGAAGEVIVIDIFDTAHVLGFVWILLVGGISEAGYEKLETIIPSALLASRGRWLTGLNEGFWLCNHIRSVAKWQGFHWQQLQAKQLSARLAEVILVKATVAW